MDLSNKKIILASSSPRRKELLQFLTTSFEIFAVDVDESYECNTSPEKIVAELARKKAEASEAKYKQKGIYIGADTIVVHHGDVFTKPHDREDAHKMIEALTDSVHQVYTGVCVLNSETMKVAEAVDCSHVWVGKMDENEIDDYLQTGEFSDKAGAYGIQGAFAPYIQRIDGCYYNIMGLPLYTLRSLLKQIF